MEEVEGPGWSLGKVRLADILLAWVTAGETFTGDLPEVVVTGPGTEVEPVNPKVVAGVIVAEELAVG